jgi:hypothetical protein
MTSLTIRTIETIPIRVPLRQIYRGSFYQMSHRSTIPTRVHTDEGIIGEVFVGGRACGPVVLSMRMSKLLALSLLCLGILASSRAPLAQRPMPGPAQEPLAALVGTWRFEGQVKAVPAVGSTDAGPVTYTHVNTLTNGGFFLETRRTGRGPTGDVEELFVYGWDAAANVYRQDGYNSRGQIRRFTGTYANRVWTFTGTNVSAAGATTQERFTITYTPDMRSATVRSEHSRDGTEWFERLTGTYTRTSAR